MKPVIRFRCQCGQRVRIETEYVGETVQCPTCLRSLVVPAPGAPGTEVIHPHAKAKGGAAAPGAGGNAPDPPQPVP
ncbi:MAG: hypothetical protein JXR77_08545 [Lentisphaeria bacterium]|nr:hypothetical protein [Lentisphaeria bacterium]